jgi:hypothetical protein
MTIQITAALVVLILGLIALVVAATKESFSSTTWFYTAYWVGLLALLGGVYFRA